MKRERWRKPGQSHHWWGSEQARRTRTSCCSVLLFLLLLVLLVGLVDALPPPLPASPPGIFTVVAYSTLVRAVQADQVLAVHLEGHALNGLLAKTPRQGAFSSDGREGPTMERSQSAIDPEIAAFLGCTPSVSSACFDDNDELRFPQTRLIYVLFPQQQLPRLVTLLLRAHVVVSIVDPSTLPWWAPLIWKVGPLWLLFLLILFTDWPSSPTKMRW